jgi:hypothetical protein
MERMLAEIQSGPLDLRGANFTDTITMRGLGKQQMVGVALPACSPLL